MQRGRAWWSVILPVIAIAAIAFSLRAPRAKAQALPDAAEAIQKARVSTRILYITAHPDDEASPLLVYLARGLGGDVSLLTVTRGQGGQNAIGPEQGAELGMLRTSELLSASQHNGIHQYFTRTVDFGFSKSAEQTMKIWGDLPVEDMVRTIRTLRPDIVINGWGGVHTGHGQHQATGILTPQAVAAAADPNKYPDQIREGLPAWKVPVILNDARKDVPQAFRVPLDSVSPIWGKSYFEWGRESLAFHRSQGVTVNIGTPFFRRPVYLVIEGQEKSDKRLDPSILAEPLPALAERYPGLTSTMEPTLKQAYDELGAAEKSVLAFNREDAAKSLAEAGNEIEALKKQLAANSNEESGNALWELDEIGKNIDHAITEDVAFPMEVRADRHELVAGEQFTVEVAFPGKPAAPIDFNVSPSALVLPSGWTAEVAPPEKAPPPAAGNRPAANRNEPKPPDFKFIVHVPSDATDPHPPIDAILPWPSPLVRVSVPVSVDGYNFKLEDVADSVVATSTGIDTYPLALVPAVTLAVEPKHMMLPEKSVPSRDPKPVDLLARVRYHGTTPVSISAGLDAPEGWKVAPVPPIDFSEAGDHLIRFELTPPAQVPLERYDLRPYAKIGGEEFRMSLDPLPSLPTRSWSEPADATITALNITIPQHLRVGYIASGTDPIPDVLRQIGVQVDFLDDVALAFGDLSQYDCIVVGIRGYELRPDLIDANPRLFQYVQNGGTLLVQYQRDYAWAKLHPAPYPAEMDKPTAQRITDPNSPITFTSASSPLLSFPNKITLNDFEGWTQERGTYFWGKFDPRYQTVISSHDPGEKDTTGGLLWTRYGKGTYIYTGLSFFRQLPAGVPGAYRLFVNLLSQSRMKAAKG